MIHCKVLNYVCGRHCSILVAIISIHHRLTQMHSKTDCKKVQMSTVAAADYRKCSIDSTANSRLSNRMIFSNMRGPYRKLLEISRHALLDLCMLQ